MRLLGKSLAVVSYAALAVLYFAFIIVGTVAWQWKNLGNPWRPYNLIAHLTLMAAAFFLIVRLHSPVTPSTSVFTAIASAAKWSAGVVKFAIGKIRAKVTNMAVGVSQK